MKTDRYLRIILTIIAIELLWLGLNDTAPGVSAQAAPARVIIASVDGGFLPARTAVFDDPDIQKKYPYAKAAQASFEILKPRPVTPYYPQMSSDAIQPAFGQAMAKQITPEQAIKQMADKMRSIMKG